MTGRKDGHYSRAWWAPGIGQDLQHPSADRHADSVSRHTQDGGHAGALGSSKARSRFE